MLDPEALEVHPGPAEAALVEALFEKVLGVRRFEERVLALFEEGQLFGTTHTCIGQEAVAAGLFSHLTPSDPVFSNHRCHGHYLLHQGDPEGLLAELMGRAGGTCQGRGGSQHLSRGSFYSNGVQGGIVPNAVGIALAEKLQGRSTLTVVFLGDGTLGSGQVYEAFNMAALWRLPILFVIENNFWAQSTPTHLQAAGRLADRPRAFGLPTEEIASQDPMVTWSRAGEIVARLRRDGGPGAVVFHTFRYCSHSKSPDGRVEAQIAPWRLHDPVELLGRRLAPGRRLELEEAVAGRLEEAVQRASRSPVAQNPTVPPLPWPEVPQRSGSQAAHPAPGERVLHSLQRALAELLEEDPRVYLLGEDLIDPYGGAFKVTRGLSTRFPDRVIPTPISEAGITGVASGMALRGLRPILEIMFGDFLTLCLDQLLNHAAKFRGMYGEGGRCPLVLRTPMGGRRGYGPTHSQTLERLVMGAPDLRVVALSPLTDPGRLLKAAVADPAPVLFVENKLLYPRPLLGEDAQGWLGPWSVRRTPGPYPSVTLSLVGFGPARCALVTYGGMVEEALAAAEALLIEEEVACEVVVLSLIHPLDPSDLEESLARCGGRLVTIEEGIGAGGWGAEVVAACHGRGWLRSRSGRVASPLSVIPSARALEDQVLPGRADIRAEVLRVLG